MLVYLAGPIDLVSNEERRNWREKMKIDLMSRQMSSFDPASAFKFFMDNTEDAKKLIEINKNAMFSCDITMIVMSKEQPSIGTPIELYMLHENRIPHVVVWLSDGPLPAYVNGLAEQVVTSFDDALDYIVEVKEEIYG